jgi:hypothetical protein
LISLDLFGGLKRLRRWLHEYPVIITNLFLITCETIVEQVTFSFIELIYPEYSLLCFGKVILENSERKDREKKENLSRKASAPQAKPTLPEVRLSEGQCIICESQYYGCVRMISTALKYPKLFFIIISMILFVAAYILKYLFP